MIRCSPHNSGTLSSKPNSTHSEGHNVEDSLYSVTKPQISKAKVQFAHQPTKKCLKLPLTTLTSTSTRVASSPITTLRLSRVPFLWASFHLRKPPSVCTPKSCQAQPLLPLDEITSRPGYTDGNPVWSIDLLRRVPDWSTLTTNSKTSITCPTR